MKLTANSPSPSAWLESRESVTDDVVACVVKVSVRASTRARWIELVLPKMRQHVIHLIRRTHKNIGALVQRCRFDLEDAFGINLPDEFRLTDLTDVAAVTSTIQSLVGNDLSDHV